MSLYISRPSTFNDRAINLFARAPHLQDMVFEYLKDIDPVTLTRTNKTLYEELVPRIYYTIEVSHESAINLFYGLKAELRHQKPLHIPHRFSFRGRKAKAFTHTRQLTIVNADRDILFNTILGECTPVHILGQTTLKGEYYSLSLFPNVDHISYGYKPLFEFIRRKAHKWIPGDRITDSRYISRHFFPSGPSIHLDLIGYQSCVPLRVLHSFLFYFKPRSIENHTDKVFSFKRLANFTHQGICKIIIHPPSTAKAGLISQRQATQYYQTALDALRIERWGRSSLSKVKFEIYCQYGSFIGNRIWRNAFGNDQLSINQGKQQVEFKDSI